jgi:hypothetical protein
LGEICYQTILQGFNASLVKDKKRAFIPYGFYVGYHLVKDTTQARQEAQNQVEYRFYTGRYKKHDPKGLVSQHVGQVVSHWSYAHDTFEDEIFTENSLDWEEVLQRKEKPDLTHFKAMSGDEQLEWLEQNKSCCTRHKMRIQSKQQGELKHKGSWKKAERMFQEHEKNPTLQALGPPIVTPVDMHMVEGEKHLQEKLHL